MKDIHLKYHWIGRILASDPGKKRFQLAGKATISLISSIFTMLFIFRLVGNGLFTPVIVAGMAGMIGIMAVMDDTKRKKQVTTLLLGVSAACGITFGSLLSDNRYLIGALMVLIIFSAFYFSKFGPRFISLGMIGFMTVYMASLLKVSPSQFPWFYLGITVGTSFAFLYNFIIFKGSAQILRRSMDSFHIQANLTLNLLIQLIQDENSSQKKINQLEGNVKKLNEYARNVAGDINEQEVQKIWPGLKEAQLRLYLFDTAMLNETLTNAIEKLKQTDGLETDEIRELLIRQIKALRDAEVLAPSYQSENLQAAEKAVQELRFYLNERQKSKEPTKNWIFLIRRIESIANHVIEGAVNIQQALLKGDYVEEQSQQDQMEEATSDNDEKRGLEPSTKKAIQALIAGIIAIFAGYLVSPMKPYWVILITFILMLGTESVGRTYLKGFQRSLGTVIGALLGFLLAKLVSGDSILEVSLMFVFIFFAFYLFAVSYTLMSLFITLLIAFMYDLLLGGISFQLLGARVIDTIVAALIALFVSAVILPKRTKDQVADNFSGYLTELQPYLKNYVRSFRKDVDVKALSTTAFDMDVKLQAVKDSAQSLIQRPFNMGNNGVVRWITIFTAINYYAKHLVASAYKKDFDFPEELTTVFKTVEEMLGYNINLLSDLITGEEKSGAIYHLNRQREKIESLAIAGQDFQPDLIHHLYYIWEINEAIIKLAKDMGAEEKEA